MSDIVEFLTARLDEDQKIAEEAEWFDSGALAEHIATLATLRFADRYGKARALAEVAAKRRLMHKLHGSIDGRPDYCPECDEHGRAHGCDVNPVLAQIWQDHPDFDPAWRVA